MNKLSMVEAAAELKMPVSVMSKWRTDGELDGVPHPEHEVKRCAALYDPDEIQKAKDKLPKEDYFPVSDIDPDVWYRTLIMKHGVGALLACAMRKPVKLRLRGNKFYLIESTTKLAAGSDRASDVLGRSSKPIDQVDRIESKHDFPGVQFIVRAE